MQSKCAALCRIVPNRIKLPCACVRITGFLYVRHEAAQAAHPMACGTELTWPVPYRAALVCRCCDDRLAGCGAQATLHRTMRLNIITNCARIFKMYIQSVEDRQRCAPGRAALLLPSRGPVAAPGPYTIDTDGGGRLRQPLFHRRTIFKTEVELFSFADYVK